MEGFKDYLILVESSDLSRTLKKRIRAGLEDLEKIKPNLNSFKVRQLRRQLIKLRGKIHHVKTTKERNDFFRAVSYAEQQIERLKKHYLSDRK